MTAVMFAETSRVAHLCGPEETHLFVLLAEAARRSPDGGVEMPLAALCALAGVKREETLLARRRRLEAIDAIRVQFRLGACNRITIPALEGGDCGQGSPAESTPAAVVVPPVESPPVEPAPPCSTGDNCLDLDRKKDRKRKKAIDQGGASLSSEPEQPSEPDGLVRFSEAEPFITRPIGDHPEHDPDLGVEGRDWAWQRWRKNASKAWIWTKRQLRNVNARLRKRGEPVPVQQQPPVEQPPVRGMEVVTAATVEARLLADQDHEAKRRKAQEQLPGWLDWLKERFAIANGLVVRKDGLGSPCPLEDFCRMTDECLVGNEHLVAAALA